MILFADSEGPDQTARMRSLIRAFAVRICPKTCFRMARPDWQYKACWLTDRTNKEPIKRIASDVTAWDGQQKIAARDQPVNP